MSAPMDVHVLLGLCDEKVTDSFRTTWANNKIGGYPDLMNADCFQLPVCRLCGQKLYLVTQIYCPLEKHEFHRTLYVFACVTKSCWNKSKSWTVLRQQSPTNLQAKAQPTDNDKPHAAIATATDDWCDDADDWGNDEADDWNMPIVNVAATSGTGNVTQGRKQKTMCSPDLKESNLESAELSHGIMGINLNNDSNHGDKHKGHAHNDRDQVPTFQPYFVNVFEEPESVEVTITRREQRLMEEYQKREGVDFKVWQDISEGAAGDGGKVGKEFYEKATIRHGDKLFHKFSKKLALCPEQCVRYSFNGSPLYLTSPDVATNQARTIPCCGQCGAPRIFELQLMPGLVNLLKVPQNPDISVEFGVVLVYTCRDSCWDQTEVQSRTEHAIVQADPDNELLIGKVEGS